MITRHFTLHLNAGCAVPLVINVSQNDREIWIFTLIDSNGVKYSPSSGAIIGLKSDKLGILKTGTVDADGHVVITNDNGQITAAAGKNVFELLIDDQTHGTANFIVLVEPRPGEGADFSESDLSLLQQAIDSTSATAIAQAVSDWMEENPPTTPVVDSSLTVSGAAADAKKVGDELGDLKSHIDNVIDKGFVLTNITEISGVVKLEDRSFLAENQNQRVVGQSMSTYDSYYFYTSVDAAAYFASANQDSPSYVAITVGYNPTKEWVDYPGGNIGMACSSALRKRNIESNLPVQESPIDISYAIVIITVSKTKTTELYLNSEIVIRDSVAYPKLEQEIQEVDDKLSAFDAVVGTVTGYGNKLIVRINNAQYEVRHVTNQATRTDTWRVFSGAISTGDSYEMLWNGQDADGVVKLLGEDDFIGGFHGDEIIRENGDAFCVYIDGVKQTSMTFDQKIFREMVVYQESDIYHCNTSSASANVAFIRNKAIVFNKEGLKIKNYWIAQETVNVIRAFFGMLTVFLYQSDGTSIMCNGFSTDVDYAYNPANTTTVLSPNMREVIMHSAFGDIIIKMSNNTEANYRGYVHYYNTGDIRSKTYLGPVNNDSGITLNVNDVLRGETLIQVRK